ncbi:MAG: PAS domain S-box protein [Candidatus Omnitrophica bacterium]|nr:PAS domain S-box protein [Candidatus Omnitrophota bacterium]
MENNGGFRPQLIAGVMFALLILLALLAKLFDIPHLLFKMPAGSLSWVEVFIQLVGIGLATIALLFMLNTADSQYRQTIEKMEKMDSSRKLLSAILGDSPAAIFFVKNDKVIWISKAAEDILGWPVERWMSEPSLAFIYPSEEEYRRVNQELIYQNIVRLDRVSYEYDYVHMDGHRVPTLVILRAINKDNLEQGLIFSMIDNTESRRAQDTIRKLNQELEKKVEERTRELKEKLDELERFREATINREFRMKELQDRIAALKSRIELK